MSTKVGHKNGTKDPAWYVLPPSPSLSLVARRSICSSSVDQSIMSAAWIPLQMSRRCNSSESSMLTMSSHSFSAQLQATIFEIENAFWYASQVDYQTQTPDHASETGELCDRITAKFANSLLRQTSRRPRSFIGCCRHKTTPSCFTAMRLGSSPTQGPLPARAGTRPETQPHCRPAPGPTGTR